MSNQSQLSPCSPLSLNPIKFIVPPRITKNRKHSSQQEEEKKQSSDDIQNLDISDSIDDMCSDEMSKQQSGISDKSSSNLFCLKERVCVPKQCGLD